MNFIMVALYSIVALFFSLIMTTLVGGCVGWTVDLVLPVVTVSLNKILQLSLSGFELGCVLGFIGGFFTKR